MEVDGKRLDDDIVSELCEPCQEGNVSTRADGYCNDCEEYMCQTCFQNHVKMKLGRNHVLGAVDAGRNQGTKSHVEKCKKHKTENVKYYCCNHDFVGCGDCIVSYHQKCETKFIRDLAKNFEESSDFKNIVKEVNNLEELKTEIEVSLEKYRKDNTEFHDKAIHEIQHNRAKINSWLQNVTSKVDAEEMEIWKENEMVLSKLEDWIQIISDMINNFREELSVEKYKGENLFIRVIEYKSEITEFAIKSVPEIKSSLKIKSFTFEPNQNLFELTKSANLGVIKVCGRNASSNLSTGTEVQNVGVVERGTENISETIILLKQEISSLKDLNTSLNAQLDSRNKEYGLLESKFRARHDQNSWTIDSLQSELKKTREEHESCSRQIRDLELQRETANNNIRDLQQQRESAMSEISSLKVQLLQKDETIVVLKQENGSFNDLNISIKSQLGSCKKEFETLESNSKPTQEQGQSKKNDLKTKENQAIKPVFSNHPMERQKVSTEDSESNEKELESLSSQTRDIQRQGESTESKYKLPDPRAAGFDVGKRVDNTGLFSFMLMQKDRTGTVTAVDPSGNVDVKWDSGRAGIIGRWHLKLL